MGKAEFERSLQSGGHAALAELAGDWAGTTRVWFEPDAPPAMEVAQTGRIRRVLGGRFLLHEYRYGEGDRAGEGMALYGLHLDEQAFEAAWVDSMHTGTSIMFSTGADRGHGFDVLGSYGEGQGGPRWGWRTRIAQPSPDQLVLTMFNIAPDGNEAKAVETRYVRRKADASAGA
ncbi:DUF1579 domain-containing protein [Vulcaniibacterium tengchongense]|uniref:Uncharacterized protein DUF1579 n=1 Tax=Vulcaniibacterium tengchongense TaxID=1273429 RepID=A0A3N4V290_9GAMM|nr:DUF1579 domain-containing protein [Vulcaniibacterium tengchongense]RPE77072.1 uncharacterized protein DUF1579 [Vulcaniibacterium tengchongense]